MNKMKYGVVVESIWQQKTELLRERTVPVTLRSSQDNGKNQTCFISVTNHCHKPSDFSYISHVLKICILVSTSKNDLCLYKLIEFK
jgi:hypothetical protein